MDQQRCKMWIVRISIGLSVTSVSGLHCRWSKHEPGLLHPRGSTLHRDLSLTDCKRLCERQHCRAVNYAVTREQGTPFAGMYLAMTDNSGTEEERWICREDRGQVLKLAMYRSRTSDGCFFHVGGNISQTFILWSIHEDHVRNHYHVLSDQGSQCPFTRDYHSGQMFKLKQFGGRTYLKFANGDYVEFDTGANHLTESSHPRLEVRDQVQWHSWCDLMLEDKWVSQHPYIDIPFWAHETNQFGMSFSFHSFCDPWPISLFMMVLACSISAFVVVAVTTRVLVANSCRYYSAAGLFAAAPVAAFGSIPFAVYPDAEFCTTLDFSSDAKLYAFPLAMAIFSVSCIGLAIACAKLRLAGWWHLSSLAKIGVCYFALAAVIGAAGVGTATSESCDPLGGRIWSRTMMVIFALGAICTNLILQKMMLVRATIVDQWCGAGRLRKVFRVEMFVCVLLCLLLVAASLLVLLHIEIDAVWTVMNFCLAALYVCFVVLDACFSCVVFKIMRNALHAVQNCTTHSGASGKGSLASALRIARMDLWTIGISVITSTIFYMSAVFGCCLHLATGESWQGLIEAKIAVVLSWLLDSLSNDACAIFIGFGPVSEALEVVAAASQADVIGCPLENIHPQLDAPVTGHVIASISGMHDLSTSDKISL